MLDKLLSRCSNPDYNRRKCVIHWNYHLNTLSNSPLPLKFPLLCKIIKIYFCFLSSKRGVESMNFKRPYQVFEVQTHRRVKSKKWFLRLITKLPKCEIYRKTILPLSRLRHMMPRPDVLLIQYLYKRFLVLANLKALQKAFEKHEKLVCFYIFHAGNFLN